MLLLWFILKRFSLSVGFDILVTLFRTSWWPSARKKLFSWLFIHDAALSFVCFFPVQCLRQDLQCDLSVPYHRIFIYFSRLHSQSPFSLAVIARHRLPFLREKIDFCCIIESMVQVRLTFSGKCTEGFMTLSDIGCLTLDRINPSSTATFIFVCA